MAAFAMAALGMSIPGAAMAKTVVVHPHSDRSSYEAPFGEAFLLQGETLRVYVRPPSSGSTGYHWRIAHRPSTTLLRRLNSYVSRDRKYQVIAFRARYGLGETRLQLRYESPTGREVRSRRVYLRVAVNQRPPHYSCWPAHSVTDMENSKVRIFRILRTFVAQGRQFSYVEYYGCEFRQNRAYALHYRTRPRPEAASADEYHYIALNGTKVGFQFLKQCSILLSCTDEQRFIESQDLSTGRRIRSVAPFAGEPGQLGRDISGLVVSPNGGLAWIENEPGNDELNYVYKSDGAPSHPGGVAHQRTLLDDGRHGYVDWDSLEYANGQVSWKRAGVRQYAPLR